MHRQEKVGGHVQIATVDVADNDHPIVRRDSLQHVSDGQQNRRKPLFVVSTQEEECREARVQVFVSMDPSYDIVAHLQYTLSRDPFYLGELCIPIPAV